MKRNIVTTLAFIACCYTAPIHALKILCILDTFPVLSQTFVLNQITGLIDRGHDVHIYANRKGNQTLAQSSVKEYNLVERTYYSSMPENLNVDLVLCQFEQFFRLYKNLKSRYHIKTKKVITFIRDIKVTTEITPQDQELFQECDYLLPVCHYLKKILIQKGCEARKIIVQHSAIDCERFTSVTRPSPQQRPIHIVTTAALNEKKGLEYAIQAIALVRKKYPDITYTIVGEGHRRQALRELIISLHAQDIIHLVGQRTHTELAQILDTAHLFMLPSVISKSGYVEGIANALKEAMSMRIPTIATYHSGNAELITHGVSGLLVPERDVLALARSIEHLIEHPEIWPAMGKAAREKVEAEFETDRENDRLVQVFNTILGS